MHLLQESGRTLERVQEGKEKNRLELTVLFKALLSYSQDIDVVGYTMRVQQAADAAGDAVDSITNMNVVLFTEW